jgi:hypothetical protein
LAISDKRPKTGCLARRRETHRLKRERSAERAHQESRDGVPKQGGGAPRRTGAEGGHFDSGITGGGVL